MDKDVYPFSMIFYPFFIFLKEVSTKYSHRYIFTFRPCFFSDSVFKVNFIYLYKYASYNNFQCQMPSNLY